MYFTTAISFGSSDAGSGGTLAVLANTAVSGQSCFHPSSRDERRCEDMFGQTGMAPRTTMRYLNPREAPCGECLHLYALGAMDRIARPAQTCLLFLRGNVAVFFSHSEHPTRKACFECTPTCCPTILRHVCFLRIGDTCMQYTGLTDWSNCSVCSN